MRIWSLTAALLLLSPPAIWAGNGSTTSTALAPKLAKIARVINEHFAGVSDYQASDLITRSQAAEALEKLASAGWRVPDADHILAKVPADSEFLPTVLKSRDGRKFMREIAKFPGGYDRLDHLAQLPRGERMVRDLVKGPDGYKMIEYMATSSGGRELGRMLSATPQGAHFNQPTGRIYTAAQLVDRLQRLYISAH